MSSNSDSVYHGIGLTMLCLTPLIGGLVGNVFSNNPVTTHILNSFAGGIIFGAGMLHLFPDSEGLDLSISGESNSSDYPYNFLLAGIVTFLMLILSHTIPLTVEIFANLDSSNTNKVNLSSESISAIALFFCLAIHGIFEGLATGSLEESDGRWIIMGALFVHKIVEYSALASSLFNAKASNLRYWFPILSSNVPTVVCFIVSFSAVKTSDWTAALFASFSAGTFLFLSLCHLIPECLAYTNNNSNCCTSTIPHLINQSAEKENNGESNTWTNSINTSPTQTEICVLKGNVEKRAKIELMYKMEAFVAIGFGFTTISVICLAPG